ncbi:MAG TPA: hypothetical protein DEA22_13280, partial [Blastocatellia bacterium]|nr:hypothetical protein [Blastocatellia bacterium]
RSSDQGASATTWGLAADFVAPGDYDGDGKFDFAIQRPVVATNETEFWVLRSSNSVPDIFVWGQNDDFVVPGDYDGDGKTDAAVLREGAQNLTWLIRRSSDLGTTLVDFGLTATDFSVQNDYDGDGKTDIAIWRNSDGNFWVLRSSDGNSVVTHWGSPDIDFPVASYDTH